MLSSRYLFTGRYIALLEMSKKIIWIYSIAILVTLNIGNPKNGSWTATKYNLTLYVNLKNI